MAGTIEVFGGGETRIVLVSMESGLDGRNNGH